MMFHISSCSLLLSRLLSYFGICFSVVLVVVAQDIVPLESFEAGSYQIFSENKLYQSKIHVIDPWIRPPSGVLTQQAIGKLGDFKNYPRVVASPFDRVHFRMRPINRVGDNTQRHGVYIQTNKTEVQAYLDGQKPTPCGRLYYEPLINECQVLSLGLNSTRCPERDTLFPLVEINGTSGFIDYTTPELGTLVDKYGVVDTKTGNPILVFDCPWIQGRNTTSLSGSTSHCLGGMFLSVEIPKQTGDICDGLNATSSCVATPVPIPAPIESPVVSTPSPSKEPSKRCGFFRRVLGLC